MKEHFATFGQIADFRILYKNKSSKKTFGFVTFTDKKSVDKVLEFGQYHYIEAVDHKVNYLILWKIGKGWKVISKRK